MMPSRSSALAVLATVNSAASTAVSWVMVKTKTRSKKSSKVETRTLDSRSVAEGEGVVGGSMLYQMLEAVGCFLDRRAMSLGYMPWDQVCGEAVVVERLPPAPHVIQVFGLVDEIPQGLHRLPHGQVDDDALAERVHDMRRVARLVLQPPHKA